MNLECSTLTHKGVRLAKKEGFCGYAGSVSRAGAAVSPDDTRTGTCGTSHLNITDVKHQEVSLSYGAHSTKGPILYHRFDVGWNSTSGLEGSFVNSGYSVKTTLSYSRTVSPGKGLFESIMTGTVETAVGTCSIIPPEDFATVS